MRGSIDALHAAAAEARNAAEAMRFANVGIRRIDADEMTDQAICAAGFALERIEAVDLTQQGALSRRAQLAQAAWCALLAGTEEGGTADDLSDAARLFERAARA